MSASMLAFTHTARINRRLRTTEEAHAFFAFHRSPARPRRRGCAGDLGVPEVKAAAIFVGRLCVYTLLSLAATMLTFVFGAGIYGLWLKANEEFGPSWFWWALPIQFVLVLLILVYNKPTMRDLFADGGDS